MRIDNAKLKASRLRLGWSMAKAGRKAGLDARDKFAAQSWYRIESGRLKMVRADTLYRIAKALRIKMESLLIEDAHVGAAATMVAEGIEGDMNQVRRQE